MTRFLAAAALAALALLAGAPAASAMTIEKIVSPSGITAWLVREHAVPLVALNYAFHGGSVQDETDKSGTANLAADLLDEGAGPLDGKTYHERLENHAIELRFSVARDYFHGSLRTLNEHREEAFDLLHLALSAPRFRPGPSGRRCPPGPPGSSPRAGSPPTTSPCTAWASAARRWPRSCFPA